LGAHLANSPCVAFGRPTCGRGLHCVGAPNLRTGVVLHLGAHLADVTCVALGRPTLVGPYKKVCLQAKICSYPSSSSSFSLVLPWVEVFIADEFCIWETILDVPYVVLAHPTCGCPDVPCLRCGRALGHPTCGRALRCIGVPNLQTCLALHLGAQLVDVPCVAFGRPSCGRALHCVGVPNLGESILKSLSPSQNLFLSIL
jgi:hypothetical protein